MKDMKNKVFEYFKNHKAIAILMIVVFVFAISIGIPTLARYRNRTSMVDSVVWDGTIATSFKSGNGKINSPYVISNGSELAYLAESLKITNYENTYFVLANDIVLNDGIFEYDKLTGIKYLINGNIYYLDEYTSAYYLDETKEEKIGDVNLFKTLKNFNGHLNGDAHTIYGLYISSNEDEELALFNNLTGEVTDLYVDNSLIYGGNATAGVAVNTNNAKIKLLERLKLHLEDGIVARRFGPENEEEAAILADMNLLTYKKVIYATNVKEDDVVDGNDYVERVKAFAAEEGSEAFIVCAQIEQEIAELDDEEKQMFLEDLGISQSGLDRLIAASYKLLGLISYLTAGQKEVKAWTITDGTKAPGAAGKIHSDFERGFIRAEVVAYDDLKASGTYTAAKEKGLVRIEGKDYVVKDGDIMLFRFNV